MHKKGTANAMYMENFSLFCSFEKSLFLLDFFFKAEFLLLTHSIYYVRLAILHIKALQGESDFYSPFVVAIR